MALFRGEIKGNARIEARMLPSINRGCAVLLGSREACMKRRGGDINFMEKRAISRKIIKYSSSISPEYMHI